MLLLFNFNASNCILQTSLLNGERIQSEINLFCFVLFFSVLDLNAFERQNKAEGLGMVTEEGSSKSGEFRINSNCPIVLLS